MSAVENTKPAVTSNRNIVRLFVIAVLVAGCYMILPLYMQNRTNALYEQSHKLSVQINQLQRDVLTQELEINKLSSLEYLLNASEGWELGLNDVPTKVRIVGGSR
ncbi:hypothetical protein [Fibrobacter sp. UWEL]|uniref:hypothetical protein n=1 Tax=Fibrobacter sp. UWEL TaxID=1896209 RepID=UPI000918B9D8|nr:hypothetical protein [Fibrobacter sp. UWEL]SHK55943.1 hypothetical protein SAMN05720468_103117 [Fibrobacter sp. UWEL]